MDPTESPNVYFRDAGLNASIAINFTRTGHVMLMNIDHSIKRETALRRSLNKAARSAPGKVHELVRRYLRDKDCQIVAANGTYARMRGNKRPKWQQFKNKMLKCDLWKPCEEPVYARAYEKDGSNKDFRPILAFNPENKFRQTLVRNCLRSFARLRPCQFGMSGGTKAAWDRIETAYAQGNQHLIQLDVEACFRSICGEQLHTTLKLPKEVTDNVIRARKLNIILSHKHPLFLGAEEDNIPLEEAFLSEDLQAFRTGIPQGSIASPLCAAMLFKSVIDAMPAGVVVVNYGDDFMLMCKDAKDATDARNVLRYALKSHPAGMLTPGLDYRISPGEQFSFLGYDVFPQGAKLRFQIGEKTQQRLQRRVDFLRNVIANESLDEQKVKTTICKTLEAICASVDAFERCDDNKKRQMQLAHQAASWCAVHGYELEVLH